MNRTATETDILIVGAGPVGLFLANECVRRGLRWRIIETRASQSIHSKALAIFPRTLEILDMAGLIGPFLKVANRVNSVSIASHERPLARMRFAPQESPYPFIAMVPQNVTEQLLAARLQQSGGAVEYEKSFVTATERDGFVDVTINQNGQTLNLSASFVVGCDGAHSRIRHLLNLPFEGQEYDDSFMLADVETNTTLPADQLQLCPNESGPLAIFPMSATRRRIVATVQHPDGNAPSLDLVQRLIAERAPPGMEAHALHWSSYFRVHHRQITQLRVGRIFVAGDAAHVHSPFGGQGMNTGLNDIWNLAWKLDLAVRGQASEELLDSYTAERRPVIKSVIQTTDRLTKAMGTPSTLAQLLRDALIPAVTRLPSFQRAFVKRLSGLGVAYRGSPIVQGAGKRYFDESLRGGRGIVSRFLLVGGADADALTRRGLDQLADLFKDVVELRYTRAGDVSLIRPDGYVACTARARDGAASLSAIQSILERQTRSTRDTTHQRPRGRPNCIQSDDGIAKPRQRIGA